MTLASGAQFGPYLIRQSLGPYGIAEAYRAHAPDRRADIVVTILPSHLQDSLELLQARVARVARLMHAGFVPVEKVGSDPVLFAVTAWVEGKTLQARLATGHESAEDMLAWAREIAFTLAAAHQSGIVHGGVAPECILITTDRRARLLDLGLSLADAIRGPSPASPARAGYAAPECLWGRPPDARSDVFSLGTILYEGLCGRPAFPGHSDAERLDAVLHQDPAPMSGSQPRFVEAIVRRCLEKDPSARFQNSRSLALALQALGGFEPAAIPRRSYRHASAIAVAVAAALAGAFITSRVRARKEGALGTRGTQLQFEIAAPVGLGSASAGVSVSPDGRHLAFTARRGDSGGADVLWVRPLASTEARPIEGTEAATAPFWSPDSRQVGFSTGNILRRVDIATGEIRRVAVLSQVASGASWGPNGIMYSDGRRLWRVPAEGGLPTAVTEPGEGERHVLPSVLADGRFLYTVVSRDHSIVRIGAPGAPQARHDVVLRDASEASWAAPDTLLYSRDFAVQAQRFDLGARRPLGEPRVVATDVLRSVDTGALAASASPGVLAYRTPRPGRSQFEWVDRNGRVLEELGPADAFTNFDLSRDSMRVIVTRREAGRGNTIWMIDAGRNVGTLFSRPEPSAVSDPVWSPDGRSIAYRSGDNLVMHSATDAAESVVLERAGYPESWSTDGRFVIYGAPRETNYELWALPIGERSEPIPIVTGAVQADEGRFAPNGKWIAFHLSVGGGTEIYVVPFPTTGERIQLSGAGGREPRWRGDGNELFYLDREGNIVSVDVPDGDPRRAGSPRVLFRSGLSSAFIADQFAASADGKRFLIRRPLVDAGDQAPVNVVLDWRIDSAAPQQ